MRNIMPTLPINRFILLSLAAALFFACADLSSVDFPTREEVWQRDDEHQRMSSFNKEPTFSSSSFERYSSSFPSLSSAKSSSSVVPPALSSSSTKSSSSVVPPAPSSSSTARSSSSTEKSSSSSATPSSSSSFVGNSGTFTDSRDSKSYKWVRIGDQVWLAENLKYDAPGSYCFGADNANCARYGKLYDWVTAMGLPESCNSTSCEIQPNHKGICPNDWHIPEDKEFYPIKTFDSVTLTDNNGFAALKGGKWSAYDEKYDLIDFDGYWWSATEKNPVEAYYLSLENQDVRFNYNRKDNMFSVRCVRN